MNISGLEGINKQSLIHAKTKMEYDQAVEQGLYYNTSKEIESFIQIYNSTDVGDSFNVLNDSTLTGFKLFFHFDSPSGLLADEQYINSALAYLKRIGHMNRFSMLQRFIMLLSKINSYCPWMFQSISGLQELYMMPFSNVYRNTNLDIKTLETIDGKMTSLFQMYRFIAWDDLRGVWVLPPNLRRFSMSIYIYDYRMFSSSSTTAVDLLQTVYNTDIRNINHVLFDMGLCEFTNDSGKDFFENVSNVNSEFSTSNIVIKSEKASMSSLFKTISGTGVNNSSEILTIKPFVYASRPDDYRNADEGNFGNIDGSGSVMDAGTPSWLEKVQDRLLSSVLIKQFEDQYELLKNPDTWKRELGNLIENTTENIIQGLENQVGRLYLGNVYGFGLDDVIGLGVNGLGSGGRTSILPDIADSVYYTEQRTKSFNLKTKKQDQINLNDLNEYPSESLS